MERIRRIAVVYIVFLEVFPFTDFLFPSSFYLRDAQRPAPLYRCLQERWSTMYLQKKRCIFVK